MLHRTLLCTAALSLTTALAARKSPPWISIESPVNPYDATSRGAALLVHTEFREGVAPLADLSGTAEGLVNGTYRGRGLRAPLRRGSATAAQSPRARTFDASPGAGARRRSRSTRDRSGNRRAQGRGGPRSAKPGAASAVGVVLSTESGVAHTPGERG